MLSVPLARKGADRAAAYPRDVDGSAAPEAVGLPQEILQKQADHSVCLCR